MRRHVEKVLFHVIVSGSASDQRPSGHHIRLGPFSLSHCTVQYDSCVNSEHFLEDGMDVNLASTGTQIEALVCS